MDNKTLKLGKWRKGPFHKGGDQNVGILRSI